MNTVAGEGSVCPWPVIRGEQRAKCRPPLSHVTFVSLYCKLDAKYQKYLLTCGPQHSVHSVCWSWRLNNKTGGKVRPCPAYCCVTISGVVTWNDGKEVPRWGVAEIQKMRPSTTGRCKYKRVGTADQWERGTATQQPITTLLIFGWGRPDPYSFFLVDRIGSYF